MTLARVRNGITLACLIVATLIPIPATGAAAPDASARRDLWRFIHPDAKALVGIEWSTVQESQIGRWFQRHWFRDLNMPGTEFLKDVDEVLISSPGARASAPEETPLLVAIRGHFDLARVTEVLLKQGARLQMFGTVPIYRRSGALDPAFALLNAETILAGDMRSLYSTIQRSRLDTVNEDSDPFVQRARVLSHRYDCWALMKDSGAMHNFLFASLAGQTLSEDSEGFEAGISVREGLAMDVVLGVRNERAARAVHASLTRLVSLAAQEKSGVPGFGALLGNLRITSDSSHVFLSLRLTEAEVESGLALRPTSARTEKARKLMIRIEGLDDGPREVPFQP